MRRVSHLHRPAFTLIELLMVVTIIGILVGLLLPAVYYGMVSVKQGAIGVELQTIASAVEQYKNKYAQGYPPDGSNAADFERHYKGIFRQIAASEFLILAAACNANNGAPAGYMDPPEALVFALGGFSTDPLHPFTGPGGPIQAIGGGGYQYNTDRNEPLYEFKEAQLTIDTSGGSAISNDETIYSLGANDVMPVYRGAWGRKAPVVYFNARSYSFATGMSGNPWFFNNYSPAGMGYARPYKSDKLNTNVAATPANAETYYKYMNDRSFQLISAGLDDHFGGLPETGNGPVLFVYPTGASINYGPWNPPSTGPAQGTKDRYNDDGDPTHPQYDNVSNFGDGVFKNSFSN